LAFGEIEADEWSDNADSLYNKTMDSNGIIMYEPITIAQANELKLTKLYI